MCEALRELMKDEIERDKKESREQGMAQGMAQIILNMHKNGFSLDQIVLASGKSPQDVEDILAGRELVVETV
jgi:lambda repressor-like predicted transcriptional regulator